MGVAQGHILVAGRTYADAAREYLFQQELKSTNRLIPRIKELEKRNQELERRIADLTREPSRDERSPLFSTIVYYAATAFAVILLGAAWGIEASVAVPLSAILGGLGAGLLLIREARTTPRGLISKGMFYTAGFILLLEVTLFVDAFVSACGR